MRKLAFTLALSALISSCSQSIKKQENIENPLENSLETTQKELKAEHDSITFTLENIPFSNVDLGDFPFIKLPEGLRSQNKPLEKKFDVCFFPINGVMTPYEGKLYKINVTNNRGEEYSQRYFEKSMEDYLQSVGAVKIFEGTITKEEYDRYHKQDPNKGHDGDIGYAGEEIKFYAIRTKDKGNIYVQFNSNNAGGKLNILQEESFKQTITKVTANDIAEDLAERGKSILYINFEVDQSDITDQGKELISEIAEVLNKDKNIKIAIEGHTDNTGNAVHNKKLSESRAKAVMHALVLDGIDPTRLSATGLGSEKPLVDNNSSENKAKNRRVELLRTN